MESTYGQQNDLSTPVENDELLHISGCLANLLSPKVWELCDSDSAEFCLSAGTRHPGHAL
jgi:hypothetical protein